jgi:putative ABC transport system substrate-binding protein
VIPIVSITADPIAFGLTSSFARPSANVTGGVVDAGLDHWGKKIQILKEISPGAQKIGFLARKAVIEGTETPAVVHGFRAGAEGNKVAWIGVPVDPPMKEAEFRRAFDLIAKDRIDGLVIQDSAENLGYKELIVELVNRAKIPAIYPFRDYVSTGALCIHSMDQFELYRNVVNQIDLLLKGTPVQDVPWTRSSNIELVLNMKAAAAIGVQFPTSLLALAKEIIE